MAEANDLKSNDDGIQNSSKTQMEINECLGSWRTYLQMLNGLCLAGTKLAQSLQSILSSHEGTVNCRLTGQCLAGWEELTRATGVASNTVKHHVVAALRDHETRDSDVNKHDILRDNLLTFINLQYQFCVACCECLGSMAECSCSQSGKNECDIAALQQCFERLYSPQTPVSSSSTQQNSHRSPLRYPLFPLQVQRRWSETAAAEMSGESTESTMRRWSMPWDCRHVTEWPRQEEKTRLRVPHRDRSRSTTPDSVWKSSGMASQDGLQEAIQLLSCRPGVRPANQLSAFIGQHIPGVTLTTCNFDSNYDNSIWPDSKRVGSPRCWPQDSHSSDHSDQSGQRDSDNSGENRDSELSGGSASVHRDNDISGVNDLLPSRKSSSSTDSCLSGNSRSGSESAGVCTGESSKSQLYSMWSGGDLPFIKLPESSETKDERPPS
ncbi:uncharacterized protein LOC123267763 isoform X1 [Cotesia glomerata]|uniref:uncharacterized protein LOC123267763 isoform X1 n=1 Tax=Cotesia glomerata TaxID=32391 RepID=UPI001D01FC06|nr:uncharacterized protein LOC123267763 isoform X1 [Cotesia glomerata]